MQNFEEKFIKIDKFEHTPAFLQFDVVNAKIGKFWYGIDKNSTKAKYKIALDDKWSLISEDGKRQNYAIFD